MSLAANKFKGIRAACVSETYSAKMSRAHNNSNVLCIGSRVIGSEVAKMIVEIFATTEFEGGRHLKRVNKIKTAKSASLFKTFSHAIFAKSE